MSTNSTTPAHEILAGGRIRTCISLKWPSFSLSLNFSLPQTFQKSVGRPNYALQRYPRSPDLSASLPVAYRLSVMVEREQFHSVCPTAASTATPTLLPSVRPSLTLHNVLNSPHCPSQRLLQHSQTFPHIV